MLEHTRNLPSSVWPGNAGRCLACPALCYLLLHEPQDCPLLSSCPMPSCLPLPSVYGHLTLLLRRQPALALPLHTSKLHVPLFPFSSLEELVVLFSRDFYRCPWMRVLTQFWQPTDLPGRTQRQSWTLLEMLDGLAPDSGTEEAWGGSGSAPCRQLASESMPVSLKKQLTCPGPLEKHCCHVHIFKPIFQATV